jgi:hypothetical protein
MAFEVEFARLGPLRVQGNRVCWPLSQNFRLLRDRQKISNRYRNTWNLRAVHKGTTPFRMPPSQPAPHRLQLRALDHEARNLGARNPAHVGPTPCKSFRLRALRFAQFENLGC